MSEMLSFEVAGHPRESFRPYAVDGDEALSTLYRFDIACLARSAAAIDPLELVNRRATLTIAREEASPRRVTGIIDHVEIAQPTIHGEARYVFRLVPGLARLELSRNNQIHGTEQPVTVPQIIEAELAGTLRAGLRIDDPGRRPFGHEIRLMHAALYPPRDHVAQYQESDLAFISRLAEHHGLFYFFEPDGEGEQVVFADDNLFATPLDGQAVLSWRPWSSGQREAGADTIQELTRHCGRVPRRVWLQDHNYRLPHVPLLVEAEVDARGTGNWVEFGEHHRTPDEGEFLARIRAEEQRCRQSRWHGASAAPQLAPGRIFALQDHPYQAWNQEYLMVGVRHEVRIALPGAPESAWLGYRNQFEAIPRAIPFRPARVTPVPRMDGLLNGRIDAAGGRDRAEIDDQGRYRVRVPFDLSATPDGLASQWVRMASPFGGDGDGLHFPLFPDTEVVMGCVNGDPDRPVILGAVPNPRNQAVVTERNATHNRLVTRSGMGFEMSVNPGGGAAPASGGGAAPASGGAPVTPQGSLAAPPALGPTQPEPGPPGVEGAGGIFARLYVQGGDGAIGHTHRLGASPASPALAEPPGLIDPGSFAWSSAGEYNQSPTRAAAAPFAARAEGAMLYTSGHALTRAEGPMGFTSGQGLRATAGVTGARDAPASGAQGNIELTAVNGGITLLAVRDGSEAPADILLHAVGNVTTLTPGDITATAGGSISQTAYGDAKYVTFGNETATVLANRRNHTWGLQTDFYMGMRNAFNLGGFFTANLGVNITVNASLNLTISLSATFLIDVAVALRLNLAADRYLNYSIGVANYYNGRITGVWTTDLRLINGGDIKKADYQLHTIGLNVLREEVNFTKAALVQMASEVQAYRGTLNASITDFTMMG